MFDITHRAGEMESDPPIERLAELISELDADDPEHPDIAVSHESGWTLSAFRGGLVVWEKVDTDDEPRHLDSVSRERLLELVTDLALGRLEVFEREHWLPGYQ